MRCMRDVVRSFDAGLKSVRGARGFLTETLEDWQVDGFDFGGPVVLTELATNAVYIPALRTGCGCASIRVG